MLRICGPATLAADSPSMGMHSRMMGDSSRSVKLAPEPTRTVPSASRVDVYKRQGKGETRRRGVFLTVVDGNDLKADLMGQPARGKGNVPAAAEYDDALMDQRLDIDRCV